MKKLILICTLFFSIVNTGHAYVDSAYTASEKFLVNVGYSSEMKRVLEMNTQNPYREVYTETTTPKNVIRRIYHYIVPGQGQDLDFYNHSIDSNGWGWKDY